MLLTDCFCHTLNNLYAVQAKIVRTPEISNIKILMKIAGSSSDNKQLLYVFLQPPLVKQKKKREEEEFQLCSLLPFFGELMLVKPPEYTIKYGFPFNLTSPTWLLTHLQKLIFTIRITIITKNIAPIQGQKKILFSSHFCMKCDTTASQLPEHIQEERIASIVIPSKKKKFNNFSACLCVHDRFSCIHT